MGQTKTIIGYPAPNYTNYKTQKYWMYKTTIRKVIYGAKLLKVNKMNKSRIRTNVNFWKLDGVRTVRQRQKLGSIWT